MLSREEIVDNAKTISLSEYSRLMTIEHLSRSVRSKCMSQEAELEQLRNENRKLKSIVYGNISEIERIKADNYDMTLNEAEVICSAGEADTDPEKTVDGILSYVRTLTPNDEVDNSVNYLFRAYYFNDNINGCDKCEGKYRVSSMVPDTRVKIAGDKLVVCDEIFMGYKCDVCGRELPNSFDMFRRGVSPLSDRRISAELLSYIITQKYISGVSFKTQELYWRSHGICLDQNTMTHWIREVCDKWIFPLYRYMKKELLKRDLICADAERIMGYSIPEKEQIFLEDKMLELFIYRTPENDSQPMVLFDICDDQRYSRRSMSCDRQKAFLNNYSGILQTGKTECFSYPGRSFSMAAMWGRVRKLFEEAAESIPLTYRKKSSAYRCLEICYEIEKADLDSRSVDTEEVKLEVREESTLELTEYLTELADSFASSGKDPFGESSVGKAYSYILENREALGYYYKDGRISLDNDLCSDILKLYSEDNCTRRLISFGDGYEYTAAILSLIHTIRLNGLDPRLYLTYLLKNVPFSEEGLRTHLMPWNCPDCCRPLIMQCELVKNPPIKIPY